MGTGSSLPEKVLTNSDLEQMVETSDQWIVERTGIHQRHIAADHETTADFAEQAARNAMEAAGVTAQDIDLLVLGTTTPNLVFPSTACLVQDRLGCIGIPAFDVNAACSGFIYALSVADKYVRLQEAKCVLVIGAETLTRMVDWTDRGTCVLFGDGGGAVVLKPSEEPGILSTHIHANGGFRKLLHTEVGVSEGFEANERGGVKIQMRGNEVFKVAVRTLGEIAETTLKANNMSKDDLDWFIPHQANLRIINAAAKKLSMPMDRVIVTVDQHGNTSSASVPLALDQAVRSGKIKAGESMLLEAFGGGFTWGSALIRL